MNIRLTHPEKILYAKSKLTKAEVAEYYYQIQDWILPYISFRPLTLVRCPNGAEQECFYQKHIAHPHPQGLFPVKIKEKNNKQSDYIYIKDVGGLFSLVQMGVLEIHPWGSKIKHYTYPDIIVFDLDPAPHLPWKKVVEAAFLVKKELKRINLTSFVKSTGGKGLHVVIPILPEYDWAQIKNFTHTFVEYIVQLNPDHYVSNMKKSERIGKIFIDYLRNQQGATSIAPYSTRAKTHATIAAPLSWSELTSKIRDTTFTIKTLPERLKHLKKDPWEDFFKLKQSLTSI